MTARRVSECNAQHCPNIARMITESLLLKGERYFTVEWKEGASVRRYYRDEPKVKPGIHVYDVILKARVG